MAHRNPADGRQEPTDAKFYLPGGVIPPFDASRIERRWASLFDHGVGPRR